MSEFQRYAIYYLPEDEGLAAFGAAWLGWDVARGVPVDQPDSRLDLAAITSRPRRYGFHGTLKPPFRLPRGETPDALFSAVEALAASSAPVAVSGLQLGALGRFLALVPVGGTDALDALAARVVTELDGFRAPATPEELARRRAPGLSAAQDEMLRAWGYPYVLDAFRFHLTLTGALDPGLLAAARAEAAARLPPLPAPYPIRSISVAGERSDGRFVALHRMALAG